MDNKTTISINPTKPSELEFEVTVQGVDNDTPKVRFIIDQVPAAQGALMFSCTKHDKHDNLWCVKLPKFEGWDAAILTFRVEVIIDGYFFEPASGEITLVKSPDVQFKKNESARPSVTTSFTVKQDDDAPVKKVDEASGGGGDVTTHDAPTNALLKPERDPEFEEELGKEFHRATGVKVPDPQAVDIADIASEVEGGLTDIEGASSVRVPVKLTRPEKQGALFKRTPGGKAMVPGLEDAETKKNLLMKSAKVREILGTTE